MDFVDLNVSEVVFFRYTEKRAPVVIVIKNVSDSERGILHTATNPSFFDGRLDDNNMKDVMTKIIRTEIAVYAVCPSISVRMQRVNAMRYISGEGI